MNCSRCKQPKLCKQNQCKVCRYKKSISRRKHIDTERTYQSKRWAHRMVVHSRLSDIKANRQFTPSEFINVSRLHFIRKMQDNKCRYCRVDMQVKNRKKRNGLTIERFHNHIPHIITNCCLACAKCNVRTAHTRIPVIQHCFIELLNQS